MMIVVLPPPVAQVETITTALIGSEYDMNERFHNVPVEAIVATRAKLNFVIRCVSR